MRLFILVQKNNELVFSDTIYLWASDQQNKPPPPQKKNKNLKTWKNADEIWQNGEL